MKHLKIYSQIIKRNFFKLRYKLNFFYLSHHSRKQYQSLKNPWIIYLAILIQKHISTSKIMLTLL